MPHAAVVSLVTAIGKDCKRVPIPAKSALIVIDVQQGFDVTQIWGSRNNPDAEKNIAALADAWVANGRPIVMVKHAAGNPLSPLSAASPGHRLKPEIAHIKPSLEVTKSVNSVFLGEPNLHEWLQQQGIRHLVLCGIQTNMCVETTARMGGNLGYEVIVPIDATHTFDLTGPDGAIITADELSRVTAANLEGGRFATVVQTVSLL
jgi:nicotinamidase-related amidase